MKKYLKYYLTGYIVIVLLIVIITFRNSFYSSVIFKDYLLTVLVAGLILTILFMLSDIFTLVMMNFINIKTTKDITAHDELVNLINVAGIIDDNCYKNGEQCEFNYKEPFILVIGARAIGKSVLSKSLSFYNKDIQYYSVQNLNEVLIDVRQRAINIISLTEIDIEKQLELNKAVTALDELVCWASQGPNNPDVLESANVIENYLGVRQ